MVPHVAQVMKQEATRSCAISFLNRPFTHLQQATEATETTNVTEKCTSQVIKSVATLYIKVFKENSYEMCRADLTWPGSTTSLRPEEKAGQSHYR